jgi:soluble lytic murein transglycosylase-like protein
MHRAAALLSVVCVMAPAFAGESLSMREYEERCASYYAQEYGVSPALVRAIIQIESAWQPGVVSSKGAMGLMQLMPATAQHFGVTHPFYIHENVRGGVAYLAELRVLPARLRKAAWIRISFGPGGGGPRFGRSQACERSRIC